VISASKSSSIILEKSKGRGTSCQKIRFRAQL
jgi:hypothetical protein